MCASAEGSKANAAITLLLLLLAPTTAVATTAATTATASAVDNFVISNIIVKNNVDDNMTNNNNNNNYTGGKDSNSNSNSNSNILPATHAHAANATTLTPPTNANRKLQRGKRYLLFAKGSRMSWRTTVKNNILQVNTLWGYGYGFRVNFPFPGIEESRRPFFKRDVLQAVEDVLDGHGFDGRACVLKSYCTALLDAESNIGGGMLFKMLKLIFTIGFDGKMCVLKAFCVAHAEQRSMERQQGVLFKLLKHVFTLEEHERHHFPYLRMENCEQILHSHCPLSFDNISPYTDDV